MDWADGYISLCVFYLQWQVSFFEGCECDVDMWIWEVWFFCCFFFFLLLHVWKSGNLGKWLKWLECGEIKMSGVWNLPMFLLLGLIMVPNIFLKGFFLRVLWWTMNQCYKLKAPLHSHDVGHTMIWIVCSISVFVYIFLILE